MNGRFWFLQYRDRLAGALWCPWLLELPVFLSESVIKEDIVTPKGFVVESIPIMNNYVSAVCIARYALAVSTQFKYLL